MQPSYKIQLFEVMLSSFSLLYNCDLNPISSCWRGKTTPDTGPIMCSSEANAMHQNGNLIISRQPLNDNPATLI